MTPEELLDTLAHDLRTPLNAILGWTAMLRGGKLDAETAIRALEVIERNARIQAQIIEDVLDISRLTTGRLRLERRPCELHALLTSTVDTTRAAAEAKSIRLDYATARDVPAVSLDATRFERAVADLLSTAVKLTPSGGTVGVVLERREGCVAIRIDDGVASGDGIAGRTDLSLALVRRLVELHGGRLDARADGAGPGPLFTLLLPEA